MKDCATLNLKLSAKFYKIVSPLSLNKICNDYFIIPLKSKQLDNSLQWNKVIKNTILSFKSSNKKKNRKLYRLDPLHIILYNVCLVSFDRI